MSEQKTPRQIYNTDERVHLCVEIVAAMTAFKGGHFFRRDVPHIRPETWPVQTSEESLHKIAVDLVIDGIAYGDLKISGDFIQLTYLEAGKKGPGEVVEFNFLERGAFSLPRSPLAFATVNYEVDRAMERAITLRPELSALRPTDTVEVSLGLPVFSLNQHSINATPVEQMNVALWHSPHHTDELRHFIRACIINAIESPLDWEWNENLEPSGVTRCRFGAHFQVWKRFGLDLSKLRDYEHAGIQALVDANLSQRSALAECRARYGLA